MTAIMVKEFRELIRDRRTVAMLLVIPIVLLIVFGYAANFSVEQSKFLVVGPGAEELVDALEDNDAAEEDLSLEVIDEELSESAIKERLQNQEAHAIVQVRNRNNDQLLSKRTHLYVDGSEFFNAQAAQRAWMRVIAEDNRDHITEIRSDIEDTKRKADAFADDMAIIRQQVDDVNTKLRQPLTPTALAEAQSSVVMPAIPVPPELPDTSTLDVGSVDIEDISTVYFNPDLETSWMMVPGLIGVIISFIGIMVTSIGLVRERESGTLEQLAVMPFRPLAIILGKVTPYFLLSLVDTVVITALGVELFDVPFEGNVWLYALYAVVFMIAVLGLGILISSVSQTTGQAIQLSIMTIVPQVMLSGLIFPLELMAASVRWIGYGLPLTWFIQVSRGIMLRDAAFEQLLLPFGVLVAMAVGFFGLATLNMHLLLRKGGASQ